MRWLAMHALPTMVGLLVGPLPCASGHAFGPNLGGHIVEEFTQVGCVRVRICKVGNIFKSETKDMLREHIRHSGAG